VVRPWPDRRLRPRTVVYAVVNSRMDYCNTVLAGAPRTVTDKLQRVLNAAACVITGTHSDRASYRDDSWLVQTDARPVAPTTASCKHAITASHGYTHASEQRRYEVVVLLLLRRCQKAISGLSSRVVSASDCGVRRPKYESRRRRVCLSRQLLRYTALGTGCAPSLQCLRRLTLPPSVGR